MLRAILGFSLVLGVHCVAPSFAVSAELDEIEQRGYLVVAVKDNWRPLGFRDETGTLVGLEIDIARQLAIELFGDPNAVELKPVSNLERLSVVLNDEVDVAIAGVTMTEARSRLVSFSIPYYLDGTGIITRNPAIQQNQDLHGQRIGVLENSSAIALMRYFYPSATLVSTDSYHQALSQLENSQADAFAGDVSVLAGWVQEHPEYKILPSLVSAEPLGIVIPKGTQFSPLRRQINQSIQSWIDSGWLDERADYWGLP
ncbi:MAG: transporter substrate-binding domain-containing protein [Cyanobacteria bacterium J06635_15]